MYIQASSLFCFPIHYLLSNSAVFSHVRHLNLLGNHSTPYHFYISPFVIPAEGCELVGLRLACSCHGQAL